MPCYGFPGCAVSFCCFPGAISGRAVRSYGSMLAEAWLGTIHVLHTCTRDGTRTHLQNMTTTRGCQKHLMSGQSEQKCLLRTPVSRTCQSETPTRNTSLENVPNRSTYQEHLYRLFRHTKQQCWLGTSRKAEHKAAMAMLSTAIKQNDDTNQKSNRHTNKRRHTATATNWQIDVWQTSRFGQAGLSVRL